VPTKPPNAPLRQVGYRGGDVEMDWHMVAAPGRWMPIVGLYGELYVLPSLYTVCCRLFLPKNQLEMAHNFFSGG